MNIMASWIPERIYRLFPLYCILVGFFFVYISMGVVSMILSGVLLGYGATVLILRRRNRARNHKRMMDRIARASASGVANKKSR